MAFCSDDKSKIHVGEPDALVSTGIRGHESITSESDTIKGLDHGTHKYYTSIN